MKYAKKFENHDDYMDALYSTEFEYPNVSWCVAENETHVNERIPLTFIALQDNSSISLMDNGITNEFSFEISFDRGESWEEYEFSGQDGFLSGDTIDMASGEMISFRGKNSTFSTSGAYFNFVMTGSFDAIGDVTSLNNMVGGDLALQNYQYSKLFLKCSALRTAPKLPSTVLGYSCYRYMFSECTSLISAPELPATNLTNGCYEYMFSKCTSLVNPPELPVEELKSACYQYMFSGCTSLINAPELPSKTLYNDCYCGMFAHCTSLEKAPELPALTLQRGCYNHMFTSCTSLKNAPVLPAETLQATCYNALFDGCTSLNYIKALFTTSPSRSYLNVWVRNVASSGTFVKSSEATWTNSYGMHAIPSGWTVVIENVNNTN